MTPRCRTCNRWESVIGSSEYGFCRADLDKFMDRWRSEHMGAGWRDSMDAGAMWALKNVREPVSWEKGCDDYWEWGTE